MKINIKNILLIMLIIIIAVFVGIIIHYKLNNSGEYIIVDIKDEYKKINIDLSKYLEEINLEYAEKSYYKKEIQVFNDDIDFVGEIIVEDKVLYIKDIYTGKQKQMIDSALHMILYVPDSNKYVVVYVLAEDNDLYLIKIDGSSLDDMKPIKVNKNIKVKSFTKFNVNTYLDEESNNFVVVGTDNKLYYMPNEIEYDPGMVSIFNSYIVYSDSSITTYDGRILKNKYGSEYKVKYIFLINDDQKVFKGEPVTVLINKNDNIMYVKDGKLYIYNKKIKGLENKDDNLKITYVDDSVMNFKITDDDKYYGFNK